MSIDLEPGTIVFKQFSVQKHVGSGGSAAVYMVRDEANTEYGEYKALKITEIDESNRAMFIAEVRALQKLKNLSGVPNILISFETKDFFGIVESLHAENLHSLTTNGGKTMSMKSALCLAYHLFDTIHIVQSQNIMHRDVKSRNICFKIEHQRYMNPIVLCDFGLAHDIVANVDPLLSDPLFKDSRFVTPNMSDQNMTVPKDDAYMTLYMILEFFDYTIFGTNTRESKGSVMRKKREFETTPEKFTKIRWIIKIVAVLNSTLYEERADYAQIKNIIKTAIKDFNPMYYKIELQQNAQGKKFIV